MISKDYERTVLSSEWLFQALQAEKKETEKKGGKENKDEKEEVACLEKDEEKEKESGPEGEDKGEKEKMTEEEAKAPRAPRRPKTMQIKVTLLDDTLFECQLDVR